MPALLIPFLLLASPPPDEALAERAVALHRTCQKERRDEACRAAESSYREYLRRFPAAPKANAVRFFRAELLWDFEEYEEAAREYARVVEADPGGRYAREAAWNRVLAWDALARRLQHSPPLRDLKETLPLPREKRELLAAADAFVERFPEDTRRPRAAYAAAKVLYDYNHLDAAVRRFGELALRPGKPTFENGDAVTEIAANLVLDGCRLVGDWVQVKAWAQRFHGAEVGDLRFRDDLLHFIAAAEIELNRLAPAAAARVWREASQRAQTGQRRLDFLSQAARQDGDFGELIGAHFARVEAEPTPENLESAATALDEAGRHEEAAALRAWADWVARAEAAATPPGEEAQTGDGCALTEAEEDHDSPGE